MTPRGIAIRSALLAGWLLLPAFPAIAAPKAVPLGELVEMYGAYAKVIGAMKTGIELGKKGVVAADAAHKPLTPADEAVWQSIGDDPTLPYRCAEDADCRVCYAEAYDEFRLNRFKLAKARAILLNAKQYRDAMVAFADSLSSGLGAAGLGWSFARPKVEFAWKKLKQVYRRKVREFLFHAEEALRAMGRCEARVYGEDDWYERFGRLYLDFLRTAYATLPN